MARSTRDEHFVNGLLVLGKVLSQVVHDRWQARRKVEEQEEALRSRKFYREISRRYRSSFSRRHGKANRKRG